MVRRLILLLFLIFQTTIAFGVCPQNLQEWDELKQKTPESENRLLEGIPLSKILDADEKSFYGQKDQEDDRGYLKKALGDKNLQNYFTKCFQSTPDQMRSLDLGKMSRGATEMSTMAPFAEEAKDCLGQIKNKKQFNAAYDFNERLNKLILKMKKEIIPVELERCLEDVKDPALEICLESWRVDRLQDKLDNQSHFNKLPVSNEDFYKNNSSAIGLESIPPEINNQDILNGLSQPDKVEKTIAKLKESLKDKDPIIYKNNTIHPNLPLDNKTERLIVNINDGNCNRTYVISLPGKVAQTNNQFASFVICHNDPRTGEKLEKPIQFLGDYWRTYAGDKVDVKYRNNGENCFQCHTKGPIQFTSDPSKSSALDNEQESKLNERYSSFKKADFATFDPGLNKYVETFNKDYRELLGTPIGPIRPIDDPERDKVLEKCLPEDPAAHLTSERFKKENGRKKLKSLIGNAMNCSSCHNPHQEGGIYDVNGKLPIQLKDYFLKDVMPHEMPPDLTKNGVNPEDKAMIKKMLFACLMVEKNGSFDEADYAKNYLNETQLKWTRPFYAEETQRLSCPDGSKFKPAPLSSILSPEAETAEECSPDELTSFATTGLEVAAKVSGIKTTTIKDNVRKDEEAPENKELHCKDGQLYFPVFSVPGCSGSCHPFATTLKFDQDGNFLDFSDEFCSSCKDYPLQKYGHENASETEKESLKNFLKKTTSNKNDNSAYLPKKYFVDGLSGATRVSSYPVKGMGEGTYILNKYAKDVSEQIQQLKGKLCP
jgi:hypothetical protein